MNLKMSSTVPGVKKKDRSLSSYSKLRLFY